MAGASTTSVTVDRVAALNAQVNAALAAEETSSAGIPLWLVAVFAILLLWVVAVGLAIWAVRPERVEGSKVDFVAAMREGVFSALHFHS